MPVKGVMRNFACLHDKGVMLLYDVNSSKNLSLPFWKYDRFSLDFMENDECTSEFRFEKEDLFLLHDVLQIPDQITCYNGTVVSAIEALCICLKYAYPCRYLDMIPRFGRPVSELCIINNYTLNFIFNRLNYLLNTMNQAWLSPNFLQLFADAIYGNEAPLDNCWRFIDGTVTPCGRPRINQRIVYNGYKRVHGIKFQSVVTPSGLIANLFGPVGGRKHDSGLLGDSGQCTQLQQYAHCQSHSILCLYGDPLYPLRP